MAKILPFNRTVVEEEVPDLSTLDIFTKLYHESQGDLRRTINNFKRFGWTPTADKLASRISEDLKAIAALVAGARNNGKSNERVEVEISES